LEELGVKFPAEHMPKLMETVKQLSITGKEISDPELVALAENIMWKKQAGNRTVALNELTVVTGRSTTATATVGITKPDGSKIKVAEIGVGPVNAAVNAIRKAVNQNITMEEYRLSAITGGSDAMCEVAVTLKNVQNDEALSFGRAVGPDIVETSVEATMAAINRDFSRVAIRKKEC
ncbi:MAG: alpha-isopropylmalate synthase regulatory domain-containing protein, partial [Candidatus Methanomethylophilus sp.]|nr:alpha-isopropylmalate synthase regulatory domain-containing protein [Methanomethylophilus sp.]